MARYVAQHQHHDGPDAELGWSSKAPTLAAAKARCDAAFGAGVRQEIRDTTTGYGVVRGGGDRRWFAFTLSRPPTRTMGA
jgi:hypothetical protein